MIRIGQSTDIHRLKAGKPLILGGVKIESELGIVAHSDGDCLVHVIAEALLGALGLGDLGSHFSDQDPQYKNISSLVILKRVCDMMKERGYEIVNIDSTILIEKPKLSHYIYKMKEALSKTLTVDPSQLNIKATTGEKVGIIGRQEAVVCEAVILIKERGYDE